MDFLHPLTFRLLKFNKSFSRFFIRKCLSQGVDHSFLTAKLTVRFHQQDIIV